MQSLRWIKWIKKEKGVAAILVVGVLLFFILFFFVVAIDFAYVYTVRGQLQNAADAAALAGGKLINPSRGPADQYQAQSEAIRFAQENFAAGKVVVVQSEDVEFGKWNGTAFVANSEPVNAIKVTTKLLATRGNAVKLNFGGMVGWPSMDIQRMAVAARPARANIPIALCVNACEPPKGTGGIINSSGTKFYWSTPYEEISDPSIQQIGWTQFSQLSPITPGGVAPFFCGSSFDSCDVWIDTTTGVQNITEQQLRCAFLNPLYDSENKTCTNNLGNPKPCDTISDTVTAWKVLSPLTKECPPTKQGYIEPYEIIGYAEVTVTDVYASGSATSSNSANNCACAALGAENWTAPSLEEKAIIINGITCVDCADVDDVFGKGAVLVK